MKRTVILLTLASLILSGCCYAPGYEGDLESDRLYGTVPTMEGKQYVPATHPVEETNVVAAPIETVYVPPEMPVEEDNVFVDLREYIPDAFYQLRYGTLNNFTGKVVYEFDGVYLRYGTVAKLMKVQAKLREEGLSLKVWDAFRPASAQHALWVANPDPVYVNNPAVGYSSHTRGNTIDVTLVDRDGNELEMPSDYDAFSALSDRDYADCSEEAAKNAKKLETIMTENGFTGYAGEWFHYTDTDQYELDLYFDPSAISTWYADCNEYINIRSQPDPKSQAIGQILAGEELTLLGWSGKMAYVKYKGMYGFVNGDYINRVN